MIFSLYIFLYDKLNIKNTSVELYYYASRDDDEGIPSKLSLFRRKICCCCNDLKSDNFTLKSFELLKFSTQNQKYRHL